MSSKATKSHPATKIRAPCSGCVRGAFGSGVSAPSTHCLLEMGLDEVLSTFLMLPQTPHFPSTFWKRLGKEEGKGIRQESA